MPFKENTCVILSNTKYLITSTNASQIFLTESSTTRLHCVQNDTNENDK